MPQSLSAIYLHLVFSTKERRPAFRDAAVRAELHAYLGGVSRELECPPTRVGGVDDHVHLLARLGRTITVSDWIKELKRISSLWVKTKGSAFSDFHWQGGYAVFSVSQSNVAKVAEYIATQEEHHRRASYQDEVRALLRRHEIEYDEHYIWD